MRPSISHRASPPAAATPRRARRTSATLPGTARETEYYDAGFDAFWELDFFGGVRRGVEASNAELGAEEAALRDVQVIVTAEVTRTYFELRGQQQQLDVARRNVANQQSTLDLAQVRLDAGSGTEFDTARAQAQLSATLGTIGPLEAAVARSIHRLSVLVGREPGALRAELAPPQNLPPLPGIVPVGDPAGLLRRRPDIRVAERELAGATARIGVAVADLFPRVTFTGSAGYVAGTSGSARRPRHGRLRARARDFLGHLRSGPRAGAHRRRQVAQGRRAAAV